MVRIDHPGCLFAVDTDNSKAKVVCARERAPGVVRCQRILYSKFGKCFNAV
jgi:hypothetical protein